MKNIQEVFDRILRAKKEQKEIKAMYKDALNNSREYQTALENYKKAKEEKKLIEIRIKEDFAKEFDKLEVIKNEINNDSQILTDIAISKVGKNEEIEVEDEYENKLEPIFKVNFKKNN